MVLRSFYKTKTFIKGKMASLKFDHLIVYCYNCATKGDLFMDFRSKIRGVKNILELDAETQKEYAREFAEGNDSLEDLLLFLWNNGVSTYFCCGGHDLKPKITVLPNGIKKISNINSPYIVFDGSVFTKEEKSQMADRLIQSKKCHDTFFERKLESEEDYYTSRKRMLEDQVIDKIQPYEEYVKCYDEQRKKFTIYVEPEPNYQPDFGFIKDIIKEVKFGPKVEKAKNTPLEK